VDVSEWEPATDAEVAMRDALRTDDQESYFRILAGVDLLLPVSADALAGLAPLGWGTWSTGGRTHVLAFTSPSALQACLADYTGSARRVAYGELADTWPNLEWWLAVNPGLPIEGYLPAWFVAQLSRGDLRLPTRGPGREGGQTGKKLQDLQAAALAANAAAAGSPEAARYPGGPGGPTGPGGPVVYPAAAGYPGGSAAEGQAAAAAGPAAGQSSGYGDSYGPASGQGLGYGVPGQVSAADSSAGGFGQPSGSGEATPGSGAGGFAPGGGPASGPIGPGGLPIRTPGAVLPSGLPSRIPAGSQPPTGADPTAGAAQGVPAAYRPPDVPVGQSGPPGAPAAFGSVPSPGYGAGGSAPGTATAGSDSSPAGRPGNAAAAAFGGAGAPGAAPGGSPRVPGAAAAFGPRGSGSTTGDAPGTRPGPDEAGPGSGPPSWRANLPPLQDPRAPLPARTPMSQTPPVPPHLAPGETLHPDESAQAGSQQPAAQQSSAQQLAARQLAAQRLEAQQPAAPAGGALPRRQVAPPSERPASMAAAAQAFTGTRPQQPAQPPLTGTPGGELARPGLAPPVIPGAGGSDRPTGAPFVAAASAWPTVSAEQSPPAAASPEDDDFVPANAVEQDLYDAAGGLSTDAFLSTLLLATVLVPVANNSRPGSAPGESGFAFRTEELDGERYLVVFTSRDRLAEHFAEPTRTVGVRFLELIRNWPDPTWSFAVNPKSPIGAKYPGPQVIALASWATESGLGADPAEAPAPLESTPVAVPAPQRATDSAQHATVMQKTVPADQVDYFLDRGYDRVAGFVHRASEVEHLRTPAELFAALGLIHDGSPYQTDAKEAFVLRWPAYRPSLYRIPYGGQSEQALRAMDGWVIERPPFRGNGFAPGEGRDVIAEFKVDSVRLPHGAQLWRMDGDGAEHMIAILDCDAPVWRRVGEQ
jgi:hypothetical protein